MPYWLNKLKQFVNTEYNAEEKFQKARYLTEKLGEGATLYQAQRVFNAVQKQFKSWNYTLESSDKGNFTRLYSAETTDIQKEECIILNIFGHTQEAKTGDGYKIPHRYETPFISLLAKDWHACFEVRSGVQTFYDKGYAPAKNRNIPAGVEDIIDLQNVWGDAVYVDWSDAGSVIDYMTEWFENRGSPKTYEEFLAN